MKLILFSKMWKDAAIDTMIRMAHDWDLDGFDLCVRPGYPINPDNAAKALPEAVARFKQEGLCVPMVTGNFDLLEPEHPTAEPILAAMDKADIRLLKLGYFKFDPETVDYPAEMRRVRGILKRWETLGRRYGVKICNHTHSERCLGLNGAAMAALLDGLDPAIMGAYMDPGHLVYEGEAFDTALAMVRQHLSIVAVKDVLLERVEKNGHGSIKPNWVPSGQGMVDWTQFFDVLRQHAYDGPVSVHCEFEVEAGRRDEAGRAEVAFFRRFVERPHREPRT